VPEVLKQGLIQIYTGTTDRYNFAPLGLCLRAAGQNLRTLIIFFAGHEFMDAAAVASSILSPNLVIDHRAIEGARPDGSLNEEKVRFSFQMAKEALISGDFDIVILSDIISVVNQGIITLRDVTGLMKEKPVNVELVLTGPESPRELIEQGDLVTEMNVSFPEEAYRRSPNPAGPGLSAVVTGDGKGKTTYCLGKAMLASCLGTGSAIFQFIKSPHPYGEVKAVTKFPYLKIETLGRGFLSVDGGRSNRKHMEAARRGWEVSVKDIFSGKHGLIVLDELNIATHYGLIEVEKVRDVLTRRPQGLQLLLSGRNAHPDVIGAAEIVIEMKQVKHPFSRGIKARKGIEF
jgi:cob(I)alamin adenosyltransferase